MKRRIISMVLLFVLLLSFAACDGGDTPDDKNPAKAPETIAGITKKDYGKTFTILYPNSGPYIKYFFSEENTGETMSAALFNREINIEQHLGVEIDFVMPDVDGDHDIRAIYPTLQQAKMADDNKYQLVLGHCMQDNALMITEGLLRDMNTVGTIDFDNDWWNHKANENLEVAGKQFFAISDFMLSDVNVVLFNKGLIKENNLEDPYKLVKSGDWTIDKMLEMITGTSIEDGNKYWNAYDTYGFGAPSDHMLTPFTYACGLTLVNKKANGELEFAYDTPKAISVIEKIAALLKSKDTHIYTWYHDLDYHEWKYPELAVNIATGRCIFNLVAISNLDKFRDTPVDFGIIPYPKYSKEQENYLTLEWSGFMSVPIGVKDVEMVGEVVELYSCLSGEAVLPAYYDIMIGTKLSRDAESKEMLKIIFDNTVVDAGMSYLGFGTGMTHFWNLGSAIEKKDWAGYESYLETYVEGARADIEAFNYAVSLLDE